MKALQLETIGSLKLKEMPMPQPGHDEILLKVTHCALCRTDAKMWQRGQRDLVLPRILGHEICGVSGEDGQRYVVWPGQSCGVCELCRQGQENLCRQMQIIGFHRDGGLADTMTVPRKSLVPVPAGLPDELACLAEPMACGLNALQQTRVQPGQHVLIFGAGPVGLLLALATKAIESAPTVVEINPTRIARTAAFQSRAGIEVGGEFDRLFEVAINAAPYGATLTQGLKQLKTGGCFGLFSGFTDEATLASPLLNEIHYRQLTLVGAYGCTKAQVEMAVEILARYQDEARLLIEKNLSLTQVAEVLPKILAGQAWKYIVIL